MKIPKKLGHIWIGPKEAPIEWMQTWIDKHPTWDYQLYDNKYLANHHFQTRAQIDEYLRRGWYAGAADLMRYEILFQHGGFLAEADSICLNPIDDLLQDGNTLYTVYENEFLRGKLVSPIMAAVPGHPFVKELIDRLSQVSPRDLDHPWKQTGNFFVAELIEELEPEITIWPSYTLIPEHFAGRKYRGTEKVYARQLFGETNKSYKYKSWLDRIRALKLARNASLARKHLRTLKRVK